MDAESVHPGYENVYEKLRIRREEGCCLRIRPDGYVDALSDVLDFTWLSRCSEALDMLYANEPRSKERIYFDLTKRKKMLKPSRN